MRLDRFVSLREINVLLIEDDDFDRNVVEDELCVKPKSCSVLSPLFVVRSARSLAEGMAKLRTEHHDVLLLDLSLPDSRGPKTLRSIVEEFPALPIVVLTGLEDEALALKTISDGAQDYVVKGERRGALGRTIVYAIQRRNILCQLEKAERDAVAGTEAKSTFLANMSHEIRTPLTAVLGFTDIALEEAVSDKQRAALLVTKRNGEHLLQVINDILDISKIESGKFEVEKRPVGLFKIIADLESTFSLKAKEKGLSFGFEYGFPLPSKVVTDELHLRQILLNLIGNAIKFTATGGVKVAVRLSSNSGAVQFEVIDTGVGLTGEECERLFQPFSQADASTTRRYGGTGLGLNISKQLAQALGGDVTVRSVKGSGSTFTLFVALEDCETIDLVDCVPELEPDSAVTVSAQDSPVRIQGRVLLADDMPDNRELLTYFLAPLCTEVVVVDNGKAALERASTESFDVILLDMHMPMLDGYECARAMRSKGIEVPIIAVTASAMNGALDRCIEAGCNDYIRKPFQRDGFIKLVTHHMNQARIQRESHVKAGGERCPSEPPIYSHVVDDDPGMVSVVLGFVDRMPRRVDGFKKYLAEKNWIELKRLAHQLSSAGLFGFDSLGEIGEKTERAIDLREYDCLDNLLGELCALEARIIAGKPSLQGVLDSQQS